MVGLLLLLLLSISFVSSAHLDDEAFITDVYKYVAFPC